jgi:hypothetical protein
MQPAQKIWRVGVFAQRKLMIALVQMVSCGLDSLKVKTIRQGSCHPNNGMTSKILERYCAKKLRLVGCLTVSTRPITKCVNAAKIQIIVQLHPLKRHLNLLVTHQNAWRTILMIMTAVDTRMSLIVVRGLRKLSGDPAQ